MRRKIDVPGKDRKDKELGRRVKRPSPEKREGPTISGTDSVSVDLSSLSGEVSSPSQGAPSQATTTSQGFNLPKRTWLFIGGGLVFLIFIWSLLSSPVKPRKVERPKPPSPVFTPWKGYITKGPVANLRKCPGTQCEKIGNLLVGETVEVLSQSRDWFRIRSKRGEGYIHKNVVSRNRPVLSEKDYLGRARFLISATDYPKAMKELEQAKKLRPDSSEPYMLATRIYLTQGRRDEAMREFIEAVKRGIEGNHPIVVNIKTSYTVLRVEPKDMRSMTKGIIRLKDGSKFRGEVSLESK